MPSTTYVPGTLVTSTWLNEVNVAVFTTIPTLAPLISPSFTTPSLGVATATSINKNVFTTPAANVTWTLASGKTFTVNNTLTLSGTDGSTLNIGTGGTLGTAAYTASTAYPSVAFTTISVATQSDVVADSTADTLTLVGSGGVTITTNAATDTITFNVPAVATQLLATITPTASANADALTVFTSSFNNYIIEIEGVRNNAGAGTDQLRYRLANAGVVDTASNYVDMAVSGTSGVTNAQQNISGNILGSGRGVSGEVRLQNMNATTTAKSGQYFTTGEGGGAIYTATGGASIYISSSAVSGIRFFWGAGANFLAGGTIRIYGLTNV